MASPLNIRNGALACFLLIQHTLATPAPMMQGMANVIGRNTWSVTFYSEDTCWGQSKDAEKNKVTSLGGIGNQECKEVPTDVSVCHLLSAYTPFA
jgi:hypothetical protein